MKRISTLTFSLILFATGLFAQEYGQASFGPNYSEQAFFRFSDLSAENIANDSWDLAFSVEGPFSVGVHLNEAVPASFTGVPPFLELYLAPVDSWDAAIDLSEVTDTLYNPEISWDEGALNTTKDPGDQFDYGWGMYNPTNHAVIGNRTYVIKLRDDSYRKFEISSLIAGVYTFRYAHLDGSNEAEVTIDGADFDSPLALFSFDSGQAVESPQTWDLLFSRYITLLDAGGEEFVNYTVAGVLTGPGVEVAVAQEVVPYEVNPDDYVDAYDTRLDQIGHTWKYFNLGAFSWVIEDSLSYFVKTADEHLWQVIFIDFEGSSTGTATFEVVDLGTVDVVEPNGNVSTIGIFPNPVKDHFNLSLELKEQTNQLDILLTDMNGKVVWRTQRSAYAGLNIFEFSGFEVPAGFYTLSVRQGSQLTSTAFIKK
jgi:hypothetical protein